MTVDQQVIYASQILADTDYPMTSNEYSEADYCCLSHDDNLWGDNTFIDDPEFKSKLRTKYFIQQITIYQ